MSIFIAILIFGLIILIHEFGHFVMARKCGVFVEEFAMGMGPVLFSKQKGETLFSLRLFPIGGFCKMLGEDGSSEDPRAFNNKSLLRRTAILSFGAVMNLALAFIFFVFLASVNGFAIASVREVVPDTPAERAGLTAGDKIVSLNNARINIYDDLAFEITLSNGKTMELSYIRNGQLNRTEITPYLNADKVYKIGFVPEFHTGIFTSKVEGFKRATVLESLTVPVYQIVFYVKATVTAIIKLIIRQLPFGNLSGPIGLVSTINETYNESVKESGWSAFLSMIYICALISANLGVFNLLPLPALDGGRLLFVLFEFVRRKPVPVEKEGMVHFVGFVLLMILAVFIAFSDIKKLL